MEPRRDPETPPPSDPTPPPASDPTPTPTASDPTPQPATPPPDKPSPAPTPAPAAPAPPPTAGTGKPDPAKRFLALFIDGIIAGVIYGVLSAIVQAIIPGFWTGLWMGALIGGIAGGAYMLVRDGLDLDFMKGRSLGKKVIKLRPERLDGGPMNLETSIKRNWTLSLGYLGAVPVVGWILGLASLGLVVYEIYKVLTDPQGRRWGDELAGTKVVETAT